MIAKESSLILLPDGASDAASVVAQAMAIIQKISNSPPDPASVSKPPSANESYVPPDAPGPWGK